MNKKLMILSTIASLAVLPSTVSFAGTISSNATQAASSAQKVWVAKDVTTQNHYKITLRTYTDNGTLVKTQQVTPPPGSLVAYELVPLSQAKAEGDTYVAQTSDKSVLHQELDQLHKNLFDTLNHNSKATATSNALISPSATATAGYLTIATGSFAGAYGYSVDYQITYQDVSSTQVNVTNYALYQQNGNSNSDYENYIRWGNDQYNFPSNTYVPLGSSNATSVPLNWSNAPGNQFTTDVVGSGFFGTNYSGYITLN